MVHLISIVPKHYTTDKKKTTSKTRANTRLPKLIHAIAMNIVAIPNFLFTLFQRKKRQRQQQLRWKTTTRETCMK